jgi:hypothetical protein
MKKVIIKIPRTKRPNAPKFGGFNKLTIPLIKRTYPQLLSKLVGVQPLMGTADVHYINWRVWRKKGK